MDNTQRLLKELKQKVTERAANPDFVHYEWFVKYHLEIVESIALELCEKYPSAHRFKVLVLAWLHDYEKIIDFENQYNTELLATRQLMNDIGFDDTFVKELCQDINTYNAKEELQQASIEIQIASSSDAASHFVGPFTTLYWYENSNKSIAELQSENQRKITVDWDKKITLPEVKQAFQERYNTKLEIAGVLPDRYLN